MLAFQEGDIAPGVKAAYIPLVRLGMTPRQVEAILGRPYTIVSTKGSLAHKLNCKNSSETVQALDVTRTNDIDAFFQRIATDTVVHSCDYDSEFKHNRKTTFTYTRPGGFFRDYPMLWVHFDQQARVDNVYAKSYEIDDTCIYSLGADVSQNINNKEALQHLFGN